MRRYTSWTRLPRAHPGTVAFRHAVPKCHPGDAMCSSAPQPTLEHRQTQVREVPNAEGSDFELGSIHVNSGKGTPHCVGHLNSSQQRHGGQFGHNQRAMHPPRSHRLKTVLQRKHVCNPQTWQRCAALLGSLNSTRNDINDMRGAGNAIRDVCLEPEITPITRSIVDPSRPRDI